jgi:hypothetical protein
MGQFTTPKVLFTTLSIIHENWNTLTAKAIEPSIRTYVCTYVCMYVCMNAHTYVCTYGLESIEWV